MTNSRKTYKKQLSAKSPGGEVAATDQSETSADDPAFRVSDNIKRKMKALQLFEEEGWIEEILKSLEDRNLESSLDAVLRLHGVKATHRQHLTAKFMSQVEDVVGNAVDAGLSSLPDSPPEMWEAGQGETAIDFLQRVYGPQLQARMLTYTWLNDNDPKLVGAVKSARQRQDIPRELLPVTKQEALDLEYQRLKDDVGEEKFDRIIQLERTMIRRATRQRTSSSDDEFNMV